jgi:AbrB family looped-hinge helix DNA binding protein
MAHRVTVQENGRVVLPAAFRKALGLVKGRRHQLVLEVVEGQGIIRTELDQVRDLQARFSKLRNDTAGADELIAERRAEVRSEEAG